MTSYWSYFRCDNGIVVKLEIDSLTTVKPPCQLEGVSLLKESIFSITTIPLSRVWRKGTPDTLLVGVQPGAATRESSMEGPQKIKNGAPFWPNDPTSRNIS